VSNASTGVALLQIADLPTPVDHRRRRLLTELALFVHGCAINAVSSTLRTVPTRSDQQLYSFKRLLKWNDHCSICDLELRLPREWELTRRILSVGVRDIRLGDVVIRSEVSNNRADVYECLVEFVSRYRPVDLSPLFFFYFAELYHPACQPRRGKEREQPR
jgi:hypothetical protein